MRANELHEADQAERSDPIRPVEFRLIVRGASHNISQILANRSKTAPTEQSFGSWLRGLRIRRKLALREVAAAVQMQLAHLSKTELGQRFPTAEQTVRLATFFDVDPAKMEGRRVAAKVMQEILASPGATEALTILRRRQKRPFPRSKQPQRNPGISRHRNGRS
jgi:transcriptional regulator with XRE-family HTH domain